MSATPEHIIRDIGRKCDEDVAAVVQRNMLLVDGAEAMASIALYGGAGALGACAGAWLAVIENRPDGAGATPEVIADELWIILRPMVARSIARLRAERKTR